jgi:hypothetical protein
MHPLELEEEVDARAQQENQRAAKLQEGLVQAAM